MMNKLFFSIWLLLFLAAGCTSRENTRFIRKNPEEKISLPETVNLSNGVLDLAFAPSSMGRLTSLKYGGRELLQRFERKALTGNPLFAPNTCNIYGFRELLWRTSTPVLDLPVKAFEKRENKIVFDIPSYGNTPLSLRRQVRLHPEAAVIDFESEFTNTAAKPYTYQLWLNLLPVSPYYPQVPLIGGLKQEFKLGNNFHPHGENWTAAYVPSAQSVIAVNWKRWEILPDGEFYVHGATTFNTFEAIMGKRTLKKGEKCRHSFKILLFPHLSRLNALWDETGIAVHQEGKNFKLRFSAASPVPQRSGVIGFAGNFKKFTLPAMKTGEIFEMRLPEEPEVLLPEKGRRVLFFSSLPPKNKRLTIVAFGDSITEGQTGVKPEANWLLKLGKKLGKNIRLYNAGVGGNSAREAMARYERDVLARKPDIVLLEFGGNNHDPAPQRKYRRVPDQEFRELLKKFQKGLPAHCKVVVITFPPVINEKHVYFKRVPGGKVDEELQSQRQIVRDFARKNGYPLLDLYQLIYPRRYELVLPDGIHLSPAGQAFFAEEVEKILRKEKYIK